jgi:hypothetical protein
VSGDSRLPRVGCGAAILRDNELLLVKRKRPPETNHWGLPDGKVDWLGAGSALPRPRDLKQRRFAQVAADELHRQRQTARRAASHHCQRGVACDVERRACLSWIGALGLDRVVEPARRIHGAGAEQHIDIPQGVFEATPSASLPCWRPTERRAQRQ